MRRLALSFVLGFVAMASAGVLWDQSTIDYSIVATVDQEFGDYPTYSTYQVGDIKVPSPGWIVDSVTTYFTQGYGSWFGVGSARLNIFKKVLSLPAASDNPAAGSVQAVTLTSVDGGQGWAVKAGGLAKTLLPGDYWVGLTPIADFGAYGQEFHTASAAGIIGVETAIRNPGGSFGFGTAWVGVSALGYGPADSGIKLEGTLIPEPASLSLLALAGLALLRRR